MTLHGAKGLEFDVVFLPGWEEGVFPHQRAMEDSGLRGLEEERRLAYVGLTRARRRVFVSYAANRRIYNQWQNSLPSRFIDEIPAETVEREAEKGLFSSSAEQAWSGGWRDGYSSRRQREQRIEQALSACDGAAPEDGYAPGDRVRHPKFGVGRVQSVDGNKLEVAFDNGGVKKIIDSFVTPA
jgi:DNA helicase-2/ATP-dependent DNA helicase PcrA